MAVFALADLHLSLGTDKPMDVFGELWRDHVPRMAEAWDRLVAPQDMVLLAGDLSWARDLEQARPDLAWIEQRPGRKLLLKGNHDGWWGSLAKVRGALPPSCTPLQNDAVAVEGWVVVGARGWTAPGDPGATPADVRVFHKELERLQLSLAAADAQFGAAAPRLAMLHYPPWLAGREPTQVVPLLERGRVRLAVYGHLHGADHALALRGEHGGIDYRFVAADAAGFAPVALPPAPP